MIDGTVRCPSRLGSTWGLPSRANAAHEYVVPRAMPMIGPDCAGGAEGASNSGATSDADSPPTCRVPLVIDGIVGSACDGAIAATGGAEGFATGTASAA